MLNLAIPKTKQNQFFFLKKNSVLLFPKGGRTHEPPFAFGPRQTVGEQELLYKKMFEVEYSYLSLANDVLFKEG